MYRNVTRALLLGCAVSSVAHAQVQFGFHVGNKSQPAQTPAQNGNGSSSSSNAKGAPAEDAHADANRAWRTACEQYGSQMARLYEDANLKTQPPFDNDQRANYALNDLQQINKLDDLKKGCAENRYAGETLTASPQAPYLTPQTMCPLVAAAETHFKNGVRVWAQSYGEARLASLDQQAARVEKEKQVFLKDVVTGIDAADRKKYVSTFVKRYFDALGEPIPAALLDQVDAKIANMHKVIETVAADGKVDKPAGKDAGAERAIAKYYTDRFPAIQIKKVWMTDAAWKVKQNEIGVITNRYKNGSLLIKAKDADYCIVLPAAVGQTYAGGGKYETGYNVDEYLSGMPVKCK